MCKQKDAHLHIQKTLSNMSFNLSHVSGSLIKFNLILFLLWFCLHQLLREIFVSFTAKYFIYWMVTNFVCLPLVMVR